MTSDNLITIVANKRNTPTYTTNVSQANNSDLDIIVDVIP